MFPRKLVASFALVALVIGCSNTTEDDEGDANETEDAIKGSPTEEKSRQEEAYLDKIDEAYGAAQLSSFAAIDGKTLKGEAVTDYTTLTRNCGSNAALKVSAQRWTALVPADSTPQTTNVTRQLFTVDTFDSKSKMTVTLGVYDERGTLLMSRTNRFRFGLVRSTPDEYRAGLTRCGSVSPPN
jgi:hypothetical protein